MRRDTERGLIEGLRLRRLADGRETLIVTDEQSQPISMRTADPDWPAAVALEGLGMPPRPGFLHSHITEASLSTDDLLSLDDYTANAITAISPGGSMWRATQKQGGNLRVMLGRYAGALSEFRDELQRNEHGVEIFFHARLLWLEKMGATTYHLQMSERVRQIMDANADLIQRLSNVRPAP